MKDSKYRRGDAVQCSIKPSEVLIKALKRSKMTLKKALKEKPKPAKKTCPLCGSVTGFDGHDCTDCGFDAFCFDPNWD